MINEARKRGELMNEAAALPGAMIAVAATIETVKATLPKGSKVVVANHVHRSRLFCLARFSPLKKRPRS